MASNDYKVRFIGDLGNLAQFSQSIRGAFSTISSGYRASASSPITSMRSPNLGTSGMTTQIDAYNRTLTQSGQVFHKYVTGYTADLQRLEVASRSLGVGGVGIAGAKGKSYAYGTKLDKSGKAIVDLKAQYGQFFTGEYRTVVADLDKVEAAQVRLLNLEKQLMKIEQQRVLGQQTVAAKKQTAEERRAQVLYSEQRATTTKTVAAQKLAALVTPGPAGTPGTLAHLRMDPTASTEIARLQKLMVGGVPLFKNRADVISASTANNAAPDPRIQQGLGVIRGITTTGGALSRYNASTANLTGIQTELAALDSSLATYAKEEKAIISKANRAAKMASKRNAPQIAALEAALNSTPPISKNLDMLLRDSKGFRKNFIKAMNIQVPYVPPIPDAPATASVAEKAKVKAAQAAIAPHREAFSQALLNRGITPESIQLSYDYERGLTNVTGSVKNANGALGSFNATVDKNNQYVETNGRSLRGHSGFLRQTARDFSKVVEWTIATTVVFGSLGLAMGSITKINTINKDLTRFTVAAKTSAEETKAAFRGIAQIAQETATPLGELTSVMDDIAIATRRANQTSQEWQASIQTLAKAVGILTNLTGIDTMRATDLLSAAYKQLQMQPEQIIGMLNKVTAVAGGNAKSIEDIVAALGSVSTAAKAAGLTLDEQIASVQVLSQVTNKTSADIATAFKNLFGAISSPGSVKILDKFGISVRTATGELRPFLQIYKDIYDARKSGRISEGQLQDVLRGISGGPRRAPDAAALLENIPLIYEQLGKAAGASNEALIANARVLDTNAAKLQKIRSAFDAALVEQFTDAVNKLVGVFVTIGGSLSSVLGGISDFTSGITSGIVQILLMAVAMGVLVKAGQILMRSFMGVRGSLSKVAKAESAAYSPYMGPKMVTLGKPTGGVLPPIPGLRVMGPSGVVPVVPKVGKLPAGYVPTPEGPTFMGPRPAFRVTPTGKLAKLPARVGYNIVGPLGNQDYVLKPAKGFAIQGPLWNQKYVPLPTPPANQRYVPAQRKTPQLPTWYNPNIPNSSLPPVQGYNITGAAGRQQYELKPVKGFKIVGPPGNQRYIPLVTPPKNITTRPLNPTRREAIGSNIRYAGSRMLGTTGGRFATGVGGGILGAGLLAGAGALAGGQTGLNAAATAGQGIGMTLAMLGGPVGMAAGATLITLSTLLQAWNDSQAKAEEKTKALKLSVFDNIKALKPPPVP